MRVEQRHLQVNAAPFNLEEERGFLSPKNIYHGDARELIQRIRPGSIALSFWSPPYFVGKSYEAGMSVGDWMDLLSKTISLHNRVLKPGGFLIINIADILCFRDPMMPRIQANNLTNKKSPITRENVLEALKRKPHYNRYQLAKLLGCSEQTIDRRLKNNNVRGGKYSVQTRVKVVGGLIEEWGNSASLYLYDRRIWVKDPCWENCKWHSLSYRSVDEFEYLYVFWKPGITNIDRKRLTPKDWREWGSRGVWYIPSVRANNDHEAKFPLELAVRIIRLFSDKGDLILDPFVGSGTTSVAAILENRKYIGFDLSKEYVDLATNNCKIAESRLKLNY